MKKKELMYVITALTAACMIWGCSKDETASRGDEEISQVSEVKETEEDSDRAPDADEEISDMEEEAQETEQRADSSVFLRTVEGEEEEIPVSLFKGEGYSVYIPDEDWEETEPNVWSSVHNEQIQIWISCYGDSGREETEKLLADAGYIKEESELQKQEDGVVYTVRLLEAADGTWAVFRSCPEEYIEGWNSELTLITDSFQIL